MLKIDRFLKKTSLLSLYNFYTGRTSKSLGRQNNILTTRFSYAHYTSCAMCCSYISIMIAL